MRILFFLFVLVSCSLAPGRRQDKLSIIQGITNSKEVEFSIIAPKNNLLKFELRSSEGEILSPIKATKVERSFSKYVVHKTLFERDSQKEYNLYVYHNDKIIDQRLIGRGPLDPSNLKIAIASCMADHLPDGFKIWQTLANQNPEYLLLIGDNVYADIDQKGNRLTSTPETIWERYLDTRLSLPIFFYDKLIPVHAVWDDHDYGLNNAGDDYIHKNASKEIFDAFFAQNMGQDNLIKGFGVGSLLSLGDFNLYFLDGRSFRAKHNSGKHLGLDQENWLYTKLAEEVTPSFLIKGDQFFGAYHPFESFEGNHPQDFGNFVSKLKSIKTPFIFISGDRHMSEIMQFPRSLFGMPSFEITSSPIHAKTFPNSGHENPWRVVAQTEFINFTLIQNKAENDHWFMEISSIGKEGEVYYKRDVAVFIKDLQNNLNETRRRRSGRRRYRRAR